MNNNYQIIRQAILDKSSISAIYQGYYREMSPHVIGTKNGREQALFYQFGGESGSGTIVPNSKKNWRCMSINELTEVKIIDKDWHTAENHNRPQDCVEIIDVVVQF